MTHEQEILDDYVYHTLLRNITQYTGPSPSEDIRAHPHITESEVLHALNQVHKITIINSTDIDISLWLVYFPEEYRECVANIVFDVAFHYIGRPSTLHVFESFKYDCWLAVSRKLLMSGIIYEHSISIKYPTP